MNPQHHGKPMYRDLNHDDLDMGRWACAEYGCAATIADTTLAISRRITLHSAQDAPQPFTALWLGEADGTAPESRRGDRRDATG